MIILSGLGHGPHHLPCSWRMQIFLGYRKVNQLHIFTYPLFFTVFSHIGRYRLLSRAPCVIQQVLISYLLYIY